MTTTDQPVLTFRVNWLLPFLVGLSGTLGVCGTLFGILMLLSLGGSEVPEAAGEVGPLMLLGALAAVSGVFFGVVRKYGIREPRVSLGLGGGLVAAVLFFWARSKVRDVAETSWQVALAADPVVVWASLASGCLGVGSVALVLFVLVRACGVGTMPKMCAQWRVVVPVLCGALVAGLGAGAARGAVVEELTMVRVATAEAPEQVFQLGDVFDARQATGEVVWTFSSPALEDRIDMHVGVRGPIVSDEDTVIGLDGETGQVLWSHEFQVRRLKTLWGLQQGGALARQRLVVSLDGTAAAFVTCAEDRSENAHGRPVLTVVDAATGQVRFSFRVDVSEKHWGLECATRVSMTDHVVVVDGSAHDLVTGEELWRSSAPEGFAAGPNGASHLLTASGGIVSDQDPETVIEELTGVVEIDSRKRRPMLLREWVMVEADGEGNGTWVNIDTRQRIPLGEVRKGAGWYWRTDTPAFEAPRTEAEKGSPWTSYRVFDPWTAESGTVVAQQENGRDGSLGVGVWVRGGLSQERVKLVRPDGTLVGEPVRPAVPPGTTGEFMWSNRTPHGIVSDFQCRSQTGAGFSNVIVMHR
ncbi:MAG: PQQ-binding-like beta-propeller repeat protein [Arachnia propionica]|uniref:outer membrane protein assembly factor BamB family protein n=1 Tax=Arachnia propionica TaxID=1750 RepID=UPI0026F7168E|nr:PQQ-binding-like beta-propeller repeat protein [Arachnia propionica]